MSQKDLLVITFLYIFLVVALLPYAFSESTDCSNFESNTRPVVKIYDASEDADPVTGYTFANISTQLKVPKGSSTQVEGWPGMECEHSKAVRWVFDLDYSIGIGDTYAATKRIATDFYNQSTYRFRAELELQVYTKGLRFVLSCISFENVCDRTSVEVFYNDTEEAYVIREMEATEENESQVKELERSVLRTQKYWSNQNYVSLDDISNCSVGFSLVDGDVGAETSYFYFLPRGEFIHPRSVPDRQRLENTYLHHDHISPNCTTDYCKTSNTSCNFLEKSPMRKYWPVVFFMTDNINTSRVAHSYHTLVTRDYNGKGSEKPGILKYAWEYSDWRDFLEIEKLSEKVYYNEPVAVTCRQSPFMFSYGVKLAYELDMPGKKSEMTFIQDVNEPDVFEATRLAEGSFTLKSKNFTESNVNIKVYCIAPVVNSSDEWVNVSRTLQIAVPRLILGQSNDTTHFTPKLGEAFSTKCNASGSPLPTFSIELPRNSSRVLINETVDGDTVYETITIPSVDETHVGYYKCIWSSPRGEFSSTFEIKIYTDSGLTKLTIILISVFGSISAIFLAVVIILLVRFQMEKEEFRRLTEEAIQEFQNGLDASLLPTPQDGSEHVYANDSIKALPYQRQYEVSHKLWTIDNTLLGAGAFGQVRKGTVEIGSRKSIVAVKTVRSPDDIDNFRATLLELKIMSYVGYHRHVVKLVAASTEDIQSRKVLIGVEFCANGNLLQYLTKRRKLFQTFVSNGEFAFPAKEKKGEEDAEEEGFYENLIVTSDISTIDLYKWSYQVASGMNFLESKKVLHADLAARNILLTEELVVKISDFGLSRDLFENSEYTKKTQVALPWKWMAIESLKFLTFSTKSDVWSFGVTLYEMFSLGDEPYPGQAWTEEFVRMLEDGMRLSRPEFGTNNLYAKIMMPCWRAEPAERITFSDAMAFFEKAIGLLTHSQRNDDECREFC